MFKIKNILFDGRSYGYSPQFNKFWQLFVKEYNLLTSMAFINKEES